MNLSHLKSEHYKMSAHKMHCDQCEMLSINGVACHERGCPNTNSRFDSESGDWIKQRECFECGCTVDADDACCDADDEPLRRDAKRELFLSDARGVYIPRDFAQSINRDCISGIDMADLDELAKGPPNGCLNDKDVVPNDAYWDIWSDVCDHAVITGPDGTVYRILQDGDCWLLEDCAEYDNATDTYYVAL
jgi:hypothetical protein